MIFTISNYLSYSLEIKIVKQFSVKDFFRKKDFM